MGSSHASDPHDDCVNAHADIVLTFLHVRNYCSTITISQMAEVHVIHRILVSIAQSLFAWCIMCAQMHEQ